jgi:hypothetical protein
MGTTAIDGPWITYGQEQTPPDASNPQAGPNAWYQGDMLLDPRGPFTYQPGQRSDQPNYGWPTIGNIPILDQAPSTASTTNIVNAATPSAGTPLTLVSSSGSGITVGCKVINAKTNQLVTGLLGIDVSAARTFTGVFTNGSPKITWSSAPGALGIQVGDQITLTTSGTLPTGFATGTTYYVVAIGGSVTIGSGAFMLSATPGGAPISAGSAGSGTQTVNVTAPSTYDNSPFLPWQPPVVFGKGSGAGGSLRNWNPNWAISRCLVVTTNGNDSSGTYTIAGYDIYGYPMTYTMTGPNDTTGNTLKAFKYIASITPGGTIASTSVSVGTIDVFGLPLRTDWATYLTTYWNNALVTPANTALVAADITTPSATTGDVRGTITATATSNGTERLVVFWNPLAANINSTVGLLGQTQY